MIETLRFRLRPEEFADQRILINKIRQVSNIPVKDWRLIRRSIDSRQKQIWFDLEIEVSSKSLDQNKQFPVVTFHKLEKNTPQVVIVGAGPAGLFAALRALEKGWRPIIVERGKPVELRLKDLTDLQKNKKLDPNSNFCFGEGGAGAFSDGKLFTRSKKRGNVKEVLSLLCQHGAKSEIMYEAHPHIGSDKLPKIIKAIRQTILENGGEIYFSTIFKELIMEGGVVKGIVTNKGNKIYGPVVLATGHSARDIYEYLESVGIRMESKGFAMGVRVEHPQSHIDRLIYHSPVGRSNFLPPAEYSLRTQIEGRGVYSFCMCPGGVIVPAASGPEESVVNGMSASGRSGKWANSGMVVEIRPEDFPEYEKQGTLGMLNLQKDIEKKFFSESKSLNVPAQRMKDFVEGKKSEDLPQSSYVPGIHSSDLSELLPEHISSRLKKGFVHFEHKYKGFLSNDAVMVGLESRTSSPVRIPRDPEKLHHPDLPGLYPVGEGAGFAGGIVSAAMDGIKAIDSIVKL